MTRGKIAIITPDGNIISSTEFNGNMYPTGEDGYGVFAFWDLDDIDSPEDFYEYLEKFNTEYDFNLEGDLYYDCPDSYRDMSKDYFSFWFSDYIYIRNLSGNDVEFTDKNGKVVLLAPESKMIFHFGEFYANDENDLDKRNLIEELSVLKHEIEERPHDTIYDLLYRLCADYDNDHNTDYTDRINEENFVTYDFAQDLLKENASSVARMKHFLGDTIDADIFILNGYGNLENCTDSDFENLINELIEQVEKDIIPPQPSQQKGMESGD